MPRFGLLVLTFAALWAGYNILTDRLPVNKGLPVAPALIVTGICYYVGRKWLLGKSVNQQENDVNDVAKSDASRQIRFEVAKRAERSDDSRSPMAASQREGEAETANADRHDDDWQKGWDARLTVLERELGKSEDLIATSPVPIYLGGGADVLTFKTHLDGVAYVTAGLIGDGRQKPSNLGEYELIICFRTENDWAPSLLSRLAPYTFQAVLNPGETMEIAPSMPKGSSIVAFLFAEYRQFKVRDASAGLLLCIGIMESEMTQCQTDGADIVLEQLKASGVFPYTRE